MNNSVIAGQGFLMFQGITQFQISPQSPQKNILFNKQKTGIILQWRRHGGLTQRKAQEIQK